MKVVILSGPAHAHNSLLKLHKHKRCARLSSTLSSDCGHIFWSPSGNTAASWMFIVSPVTSVKAKQEPPAVTEWSRSVRHDQSLICCQSQPWVRVFCVERGKWRKKAEREFFYQSLVGMCEIRPLTVTLNTHSLVWDAAFLFYITVNKMYFRAIITLSSENLLVMLPEVSFFMDTSTLELTE